MLRLDPYALALLLLPIRSLAGDPPLINVKDLNSAIVVDMRYASPDNFTGEKLYPVAECLLCEPVAQRLARAQNNLEKQGLGLKVWDCYRPLSVQKKLWALVPDPRYVADPRSGSRHNRGASVDLTLVDAQGRELPMPTPFDEFTERAHRNYRDAPPEAIKNRAILQEAMENEGFAGLLTEWWHFDDPRWSTYALRDEPLGNPALRVDLSSSPSTALIPSTVKQILGVTSPGWASATGELQRFERVASGWRKVGTPWPVTLGAKGMAWGRGLHPGAPVMPKKAEADLTAPAGVFKLGLAFGYAPSAPEGSSWLYQQVDETWRCIDDPASRLYNQVVKASPALKDWNSAEVMKREDHLYRWVINIEQNYPEVTSGCGSCIFLHVWRQPGSPTEGCTAMAEDRMVELLKWLKPQMDPRIVQLPQQEYKKVKKEWGLP